MRFANRLDAGRWLADDLASRAFDRPVVIGLPRGGVPVASPTTASPTTASPTTAGVIRGRQEELEQVGAADDPDDLAVVHHDQLADVAVKQFAGGRVDRGLRADGHGRPGAGLTDGPRAGMPVVEPCDGPAPLSWCREPGQQVAAA